MHSNLIGIANRTIPKPKGRKITKHENGNTADIIRELLRTNELAQGNTKRFARFLKGDSLESTCRNVWAFARNDIRYVLDGFNIQIIKTPAATWADRFADCKGHTIFISSCLRNLGIEHEIRFASYSGIGIDNIKHVYCVVKRPKLLIVDSVMPGFNREEPFRFKKDFKMTKIIEISGLGQGNNDEDGDDIVVGATAATGRATSLRARLRPNKLKAFRALLRKPGGIRKIFNTGTAQTSRVIERVVLGEKAPIRTRTVLIIHEYFVLT